jgi:hypothetical protein
VLALVLLVIMTVVFLMLNRTPHAPALVIAPAEEEPDGEPAA